MIRVFFLIQNRLRHAPMQGLLLALHRFLRQINARAAQIRCPGFILQCRRIQNSSLDWRRVAKHFLGGAPWWCRYIRFYFFGSVTYSTLLYSILALTIAGKEANFPSLAGMFRSSNKERRVLPALVHTKYFFNPTKITRWRRN